MSLNKDEFGQTLRVNLGEDISSATSYKMFIEPQLGTLLEKTATLGTTNVDVDDETYLANQYVEYTTIDGDMDYAGTWRLKGIAVYASSEIHGDYKKFTVLE